MSIYFPFKDQALQKHAEWARREAALNAVARALGCSRRIVWLVLSRKSKRTLRVLKKMGYEMKEAV